MTERHSAALAHWHRYRWTATAVIDISCAVTAVLVTVIGASAVQRGEPIFGLSFALSIDLACLSGILAARVAMQSIAVSSDGVSSYLLCLRTKYFRWKDVRKMIRLREVEMFSQSYTDKFYVFGQLDGSVIRKNGPILFSQDISNLRELLDSLNIHAASFQIPILAIDRKVTSNNSPRKRGWFSNFIPSDTEYTLDRL